MMSKLIKGALCMAMLGTLWLTTPEAQAQRRGGGNRGGRGTTSVQIGPSGVYVGPSYGGRSYGGRSYGGRYYDGWNSRSYYGRPYNSYYWNSYPSSYYYPRTYYYDQAYVTPSTTYESYYPSTTSVQAAETARVRVRVPDANAEVWFNGSATQQRGTDRVFDTPPLTSGVRHSYEIRARWTGSDGQARDRTQTIDVEAGRESVADFTR